MARSTDPARRSYFHLGAWPFWGVHVAAVIGVILVGWSWTGLALALSLYVVRMFFVTAGYHRYFSHRAFKTSRWFQFVLGVGAQSSLQRGVLWWAGHHRKHHKYSDQPEDVHSVRQDGFWWSHIGWVVSPTSDEHCDHSRVRDLAKFPELRALDRSKHLVGILLGFALFFIGGAHALVWGLFVSTVLLWHGTFTINSLAHVIGTRRYATGDDSRNHWGLALITLGEGWHNNHHHYMTSANQGFFWWEIDISFYVLRVLEKVGLVWDLRRPPAHVVANRPAAHDEVASDGPGAVTSAP